MQVIMWAYFCYRVCVIGGHMKICFLYLNLKIVKNPIPDSENPSKIDGHALTAPKVTLMRVQNLSCACALLMDFEREAYCICDNVITSSKRKVGGHFVSCPERQASEGHVLST